MLQFTVLTYKPYTSSEIVHVARSSTSHVSGL